MAGKYQKEYEWSLENRHIQAAKQLLALAALYSRHQDAPTLGLIEAAVDDVRKAMNASNPAPV